MIGLEFGNGPFRVMLFEHPEFQQFTQAEVADVSSNAEIIDFSRFNFCRRSRSTGCKSNNSRWNNLCRTGNMARLDVWYGVP